MQAGIGQIVALILEDGHRYVRVLCPESLIPMPGQYLLASNGSDSILPVPLFYTDSAPQGFLAAAPDAISWTPGFSLHLRGPLGRGFSLPLTARKVGLVAWDNSPARLRGLIQPALQQDAAVVLLNQSVPENLPDEVEVQPISSLQDVLEWTDYLAIDVPREKLGQLREELTKRNPLSHGMEVQVLLRTAMPCGGIAECGVCAVTLSADWKLVCKEGPVFGWRELF